MKLDSAWGLSLGEPQAAQNDHVDAVRALLVCGATPDRPNLRGENALIVAARSGNVDCIKCLLDSGSGMEYCIAGGALARSLDCGSSVARSLSRSFAWWRAGKMALRYSPSSFGSLRRCSFWLVNRC